MTPEKPVILLVHDAFQEPAHYETVLGPLRDMGFTIAAPKLPTTGADPSLDYTDDVEVINRELEPLLEAGREVIVLAHSFGTLPASHCIEGESVAERHECGFRGGIIHYINVCGFSYPQRGCNIMGKNERFPLQNYYNVEVGPPVVVVYGLRINGLVYLLEKAKAILYSDLTPHQAEGMWSTIIKTHSERNINSFPKFVDKDMLIPKTYVFCENDLALAVEYQAYFVGNGAYEDVIRLPSGHFPFSKMPERMVEVVCQISERCGSLSPVVGNELS